MSRVSHATSGQFLPGREEKPQACDLGCSHPVSQEAGTRSHRVQGSQPFIYLTFMDARHSSRWPMDFNPIKFVSHPTDLGTVLIVILRKGKLRHRKIEISQDSVTD